MKAKTKIENKNENTNTNRKTKRKQKQNVTMMKQKKLSNVIVAGITICKEFVSLYHCVHWYLETRMNL